MNQVYSTRPEAVVVCLCLCGIALAFVFTAFFNLGAAGREHLAATRTGYFVVAAVCLLLAVWLWRREIDTDQSFELSMLLALLLVVASILWTEYRWPDVTIGPTGYMLIITSVSGLMLRRGWVLALFLVSANTAFLVVDALGEGPAHFGRVQHTLIGVSISVAITSFLLLRLERDRQARLTEALTEQVRFDLLTGVLTRQGLMEKLVNCGGPDRRPVWSAYIDVNHFKSVNDRFGHAHGDRVLASVGSVLDRLGASLGRQSGEDVWIARWGGDEFVAIGCSDPPDEDWLEDRLNELLDQGAFPCRVTAGLAEADPAAAPDGEFPAPASRPDQLTEEAEALIRRADHRMYERRRIQRGIEKPLETATTEPEEVFPTDA